jgi:hypothetical protein
MPDSTLQPLAGLADSVERKSQSLELKTMKPIGGT